MTRTITVKGTGKASASPDWIVLSMDLESKDFDYEKAMEKASEKIDLINITMKKTGFDKKSIKTTDFSVDMDYDWEKDRRGESQRVFKGYRVRHGLKVEFDFDQKRLAEALSAVASCLAHPNLSIDFTIKDPAAIKEEMLRSAAENAREKAKILCAASGTELGELLTIDYSWGEINLYSNTNYGFDEDCNIKCCSKGIDIEPEDIKVSDSVTFVWEIK